MKNTRNLMGACLMLLSVNAWSAGFNDNGDGTVTDFATGLMWQQGDMHNNSTRNYSQSIAYCDGLSLAGESDWRLPRIKELSSIIDFRRFGPSIELAYFLNTISSFYRSASSVASDSDNAWGVSFNRGEVLSGLKTNGRVVRCVR